MSHPDAWRMIRRRAPVAGIAEEIGCHTLEHAQEMAAHESPRTTKL
jgi:hypothetical protein